MRAKRSGEEGYLLLTLTVAVFLMLLLLAVAAPSIAKSLERDRELESQHRAQQYVRGIQLYYRKLGHYPTSMDQLDSTNNLHFLRQHYVDPLTGKEYRLIAQGAQQTQVKGFFGEPLQGLPAAGGLSSGFGNGQQGTGTGPSGAGGIGGATGGGGLTSSFGSGGSMGSAGSSGVSGSTFGSGTQGTASQGPGAGGIGGISATSFKGGGGPFVGVGTTKTGKAILAWNGEEDFAMWEFLYDPRVEMLKQKVSLLGGGGVSSSPASGFGAGSGFAPIGGAPGSTGAAPGGTGRAPNGTGGMLGGTSPGGASPR